jgi:uncharacterized Zn finger protein (UPF0148 family)
MTNVASPILTCSHCGSALEDGDAFCPECGDRVAGTQETVTSAETVAEEPPTQQSEWIPTEPAADEQGAENFSAGTIEPAEPPVPPVSLDELDTLNSPEISAEAPVTRAAFCESCGSALEDGDAFCPECGARVADSQETVTSAETVTEEPPTPQSEWIPTEPAAGEQGAENFSVGITELSEPTLPTGTIEPAEPSATPSPPTEADAEPDAPSRVSLEKRESTLSPEPKPISAAAKTPIPAGTFCDNCGAPLAERDIFCQGCGVRIAAPEQEIQAGSPALTTKPNPYAPVGYGQAPVRNSASSEYNERIVDRPSDEHPTRVSRATSKKSKKSRALKVFIIVLSLFLVVGVAIGGGGYYYFFHVRNKDVEGDDVGAPEIKYLPPRDLTPLDIYPGGNEGPLSTFQYSTSGLQWSEVDSNGYSFLTASDPTHIFSSQPSLSGRIIGSSVNFRAAPNVSSRVISQFNGGEVVKVVQRYTSMTEIYPWYRIQRGGRDGWVYGEYIEFVD